MNGAEQRARFTAVSRIERRMDDLELVAEHLAKRVVAAHEATSLAFGVTEGVIAKSHADLTRRVDAMTTDRDQRIAAWEALTLWQRLRWVARGVAR